MRIHVPNKTICTVVIGLIIHEDNCVRVCVCVGGGVGGGGRKEVVNGERGETVRLTTSPLKVQLQLHSHPHTHSQSLSLPLAAAVLNLNHPHSCLQSL